MELDEIKRRRMAYNLCQKTDICRGNLGIGRSNMPQILKEHMDTFLDKLEEKDIDVERNLRMPANKLRATQGEINGDKVEEMPESKIGKKPILISEDNYILDGHHQWAKAMLLNPKTQLIVNRIDLPIKELFHLTKTFEHVKYTDIHDKVIHAMAKLAKERRMKKAAAELVKIANDVMAWGDDDSDEKKVTITFLMSYDGDRAAQEKAHKKAEKIVHHICDEHDPVYYAAFGGSGTITMPVEFDNAKLAREAMREFKANSDAKKLEMEAHYERD